MKIIIITLLIFITSCSMQKEDVDTAKTLKTITNLERVESVYIWVVDSTKSPAKWTVLKDSVSITSDYYKFDKHTWVKKATE